MKKRKKRWNGISAGLLCGAICLYGLLGLQPPAKAALQAEKLIPVGHTVGIKLFSDGVLVVGLSQVEGSCGRTTPAADCGLRVGDVIEEAAGQNIRSNEEFAHMLQKGGEIPLTVNRNGKEINLTAAPAPGPDGVYRLGAWIRDSIAGIGTVTFYDPDSGVFGALGHGITDSDTGNLVPLSSGAVMGASVKAVRKGTAGEPGELRGSFDMTKDLGPLSANTERGIFGTLPSETAVMKEPIPVGHSDEVHTGRAMILSNVAGDRVESYAVDILKFDSKDDAKNFLLEVQDPRLLSQTGGIVQGMSGSPILQDGKLIGAVTHVLVNDPTRGYGIFIENMLEAAG